MQDIGEKVLCLNDMGGAVMQVTYDKTNSLRANMKHHEPIVLVEGLDLWNDITTGWVSITLQAARSDPHHLPCVLVENNGISRDDSRPSDTEIQ